MPRPTGNVSQDQNSGAVSHGRRGWVGWVARLFGIGKRRTGESQSKNGESSTAARNRAKAAEPVQRPRFSEPLESRRMLSGASPLNFQPAHFYAVPTTSIVAGNLVNGGLPDLVSVDGGKSSVNILLNNGDGSFHLARTYFVPDVRKAAVADFNGDGNQDMAVMTNQGNGTSVVYIFYGEGDGTFFAGATAIPIDFGCVDMKAVDLNGDGLPDLVLTVGRRVITLLNKGDGKFAPAVPYFCGAAQSGAVEVGDFNNDGVPDLAITRFGANEIAVLLGQTDSQGHATGTFGQAIVLHVGINPATLAIGDFNGDGKLDIAVANSGFKQAAMEVLLGNGDGTFGAAQPYFGGNFVDDIAVGDFNGDGFQDIATGSFTSQMRIYGGNGDGTFQPFVSISSAVFAQSMAVADFNGDGVDDIASASGYSIRVLMGEKANAPPPPTPTALDVTLGVGGVKSITYQDVSGYAATISLNGAGTANVVFSGDNLTLSNNGAHVVGGTAAIQSIDATGTTSATTLSIDPQTLNGRVDIGSISTDGSLGFLLAARVNLTGNLTVAGSARRIVLDSAINGTLAFGSSDEPVSLVLHNVSNESLNSSQPIGLLESGQWTSPNPATPGQISAPSIRRILMGGQFSPDMTIGAGGIKSFHSRQITGGAWAVAGPVGTMTIAQDATVSIDAASINSILAGSVLSLQIDTTGNINSISGSGLVNSTIEAGVGPLPSGQRLPQSQADFTNSNARIGVISLRERPLVSSFENSTIAAPSIGRLGLKVVAFSNGGAVEGVAADSIGSLSGIESGTGRGFALVHPISLAPLVQRHINTGDFVLQII